MNKFFKAAISTVKVGAALAIVALPVDLIVRGADSVWGGFFLNLMGA